MFSMIFVSELDAETRQTDRRTYWRGLLWGPHIA